MILEHVFSKTKKKAPKSLKKNQLKAKFTVAISNNRSACMNQQQIRQLASLLIEDPGFGPAKPATATTRAVAAAAAAAVAAQG